MWFWLKAGTRKVSPICVYVPLCSAGHPAARVRLGLVCVCLVPAGKHEITDQMSHSPKSKPDQGISAISWPCSASEGIWGRLLGAQDIQSLPCQGSPATHTTHTPLPCMQLRGLWTPLSILGHPTGLSGLSHLCSKQRHWGQMEMPLLDLGRYRSWADILHYTPQEMLNRRCMLTLLPFGQEVEELSHLRMAFSSHVQETK